MRRVWKLAVVLGCLLIAAIVVVACSSGSSNMNASGMGTVNVTLSDPATCQAPDGQFAHVYVTITDVKANVNATAQSSDSNWVDLTPNMKPTQIDLLGQANNQCFLATLGATTQLQAGTYQQIRLILSPNTATVANNACGSAANCVVLTSDMTKTYPLLLSSEAQTGIKIPSGQIANGGFTIASGKTEDLDIDFNTCQSIVREGNGQFRLKPVLHAGEVSTTSTSINGTVVDKATGKTVDGKVFVAVEQPDANKVDRIVMSTKTNPDGSFVFCPLPSGTYDVVIVGTNTNGALYQPTIVTGVSVGDTIGTVSLAMPTVSTTASLSGQVTAQNSSMAGTIADVQLSALEMVNSINYTIPLPPYTNPMQDTDTLSVETGPSQPTATPPITCPNGTDCANFTMVLPSGGVYAGAWASGGVTLKLSANLASYAIDGMATVPGSGGTADCSPSEVTTSANALTGTGPFTVSNLSLAFKSCN